MNVNTDVEAEGTAMNTELKADGRARTEVWRQKGARASLTGVWKQAKRLTRKGWRMLLITSKMRFSDIKLSTSSRAMMSPFFSALMAKYSFVFRYCVNSTCLTVISDCLITASI